MTDSLPLSNKQLCSIVMDVTEVSSEILGNDNLKGYEIKCLNCNKYKKFVPRSQGFTNASEHWKRCVKEQALTIYQERLHAKNSSQALTVYLPTTNDQVSPIDPVKFRAITNWHRSLFMWIEKITKLNQPVNIVENKIEREHVKYGECKSTKTVLDTMFHLVTVVEEKLTVMMINAPFCQAIYDAWTKNGTHFLGLYASFMRSVDITVSGIKIDANDIHECRLLSVSPMPALIDSVDENGNINDGYNKEAVEFNADHHINFMKECLEYYDKIADDFIVCQCADSAGVNISVANKMSHPHISCKNHNLNLQCDQMVDEDNELSNVVDAVCNLAASIRGSSKATTALRNAVSKPNTHSSVRAKARSVTRKWVGEERALAAHIKLKDHFSKLMDDGVTNLGEFHETIERSFIEKTQRHHKYLEQIQKVSKYLQTRNLPLCKAQGSLDLLMRKVRSGRNMNSSKLYTCKLQSNKINTDNGLSTDPNFERGVAKIQQGVVYENQMTIEEKNACKILLKHCESMSDDEVESEDEDLEEDITRAIEIQEKRKAKEIEGQSKYINCDFVMGSAAIVEQLWSKGGCVYTSRRLGMSPMVFEMIMFLKENADLWKINDVVIADERRKDTDKDTRAKKKIDENNIIEQLQQLVL